MLRPVAVLAASLASFAPLAVAQQEATLKVGDPAPPLVIEKWVKGAPIAKFEKGHVYVVEFWATWCGPCIASMPHISALQRDYAGKVTVIGTNIWEDKEYSEKTYPKVEKFVEGQGERMGYAVAYDGPSKTMEASYMRAAGRNGIPSAFIVDRAGVIAWMGHPARMDFALNQIVEGKWDLKTGPEREKEVYDRLNGVRAKMKTEPAAAQADFDKFAADFPFLAKHQEDVKLELLKANGKWDAAYAIMTKQVDAAIAFKEAGKLNAIAWSIVDPEAKVEPRDFALALRAAQAAAEITDSKNPSYLDTLARVHAWRGDLAKAIELQTLAVELASEKARPNLQKSLDEYKAKASL